MESIIVERLFYADAGKVWKAITDKDEMKKWYFDLPDFEARVGCRFQFSGGPSPERQYVHLCEVTEVVENQKLTYSWSYEGYAGMSWVTFELEPQGGTTLVRLIHGGVDSFPADNPDLARQNFVDGWSHIILIGLKNYVEPGC